MQSSRSTHLPLALGLALAVIAGVCVAAQGRVNGQLGAALGDGVQAALISFSVGTVLILILGFSLPSGRRALAQFPGALRNGAFPWWYLLAGVIGAYFVMSQGLVVGFMGIAVFTVAYVCGQTLGGVFVDTVGFGPGGRRPVSWPRVVGVLLLLVAVVWAVSPRMGATLAHPATLLLPMLLPLTAGITNGFQTAMNGTQTAYFGSFVPATVANFVSGTAALFVVWAIERFAGATADPLPHQPWMYLGGAFGVTFIGLSAYLAKQLGVLLTSLGMIAGQLVGSLVLDALWPASGAHVALATVLGSALAIGAVALASVQSKGHTAGKLTR